MRFVSSEKVLFSDSRTSRKTGRFKIDKQTGEAITTKDGMLFAEKIQMNENIEKLVKEWVECY